VVVQAWNLSFAGEIGRLWSEAGPKQKCNSLFKKISRIKNDWGMA
jgi:hypothetical protein